jgi:hypothetical protein
MKITEGKLICLTKPGSEEVFNPNFLRFVEPGAESYIFARYVRPPTHFIKNAERPSNCGYLLVAALGFWCPVQNKSGGCNVRPGAAGRV